MVINTLTPHAKFKDRYEQYAAQKSKTYSKSHGIRKQPTLTKFYILGGIMGILILTPFFAVFVSMSKGPVKSQVASTEAVIYVSSPSANASGSAH